MGSLQRRAGMPLQTLKPGQADVFAKVLRERLLGNKGFAKQYLRLLVTEIRLNGRGLQITGRNAALAQAVAQTKAGALTAVPTFDRNWLPDQGSNLGPAD